MASYERYNLPDAIKGRTYLGQQFTILKNSVAVDLTDSNIVMEIESKKDKKRVINWSTDSGELTIIDAVNGIFKINEQVINLPVDNYGYGIIFYLANGTVFEYIYGNFNVLDITPNG